MRKITSFAAFSAALVLAVGCGDSESSVPSPVIPPDAGPVMDAGISDASIEPEPEPDAGEIVDEEDAGDVEADAAEPEDANVPPEPWTDSEKPLNDESALSGIRANFSPALIVPSGKTGGTPAQFLAFPFPADHRRHEDGTIRLDDFPRPNSLAQTIGENLLDKYLAPHGGVDGFSLNGAVHVSFTGALDLSGVSQTPGDFLSDDAPFKIIDIDPNSEERGRVRPLRWEWQAKAGNYAAANSLAVAPAWGFPLRQSTKYAFVMTKSAIQGANGESLRQPLLLSALLANRQEKPADLFDVSDALYETLRTSYAPLRETLAAKGIDIREVAAATVFTTQNVTQDLERISASLRKDLSNGIWTPKATYAPTEISYWGSKCYTASSSDTWATCTYKWSSTEQAKLFQLAATFESRNYQRGELPYMYEGGYFEFGYNGIPKYSNETLTLMVTIPEKPLVMDGGCIPIVEIAHGTGGSAYSGLGDGTSLRLAGRGIASVGMDQPIHGDRFDAEEFIDNMPSNGILGTILQLAGQTPNALSADTLLELLNFNFLNLDSARSSIRQSAVDTMALTHLIQTGGLDVPAEYSPTGKAITFCRDKIGFFGHSQGALSGALAQALEHRIGGWLLSAGGGGLGITILDRSDYGDFTSALAQFGMDDFADLLGMLFNLKDEKLTEQHILMTMIQTVVDVTDPINYAPYWLRDDFGDPTNQLCTSGLLDSQTPARAARAYATAAGLTPMKPLVTSGEEFQWAGLTPADAPLSGNNLSANGILTTNAFIQWANDGNNVNGESNERWAGHFLVFHRPEAINASMRFLQTYFAPETAEGVPSIERDVNADVRSETPIPVAEGRSVIAVGARSPAMSRRPAAAAK